MFEANEKEQQMNLKVKSQSGFYIVCYHFIIILYIIMEKSYIYGQRFHQYQQNEEWKTIAGN